MDHMEGSAHTSKLDLPSTPNVTSWSPPHAGSTPKPMCLMRRRRIKQGRVFGRATLKSLQNGEGNKEMEQLLLETRQRNLLSYQARCQAFVLCMV